MNFQIYWLSRGKEKHIRVDADSEQAAIASFRESFRWRIIRVVDVTNYVKNLGLSCW